MPVIWGHIQSIVNDPNIPPSLVVRTRTALGTYRLECVIGKNTRIARGFERLSLEKMRGGEFVVVSLREHAGWLEAERIDIIKLEIHSAIGIREEGIPTKSSDRIA